MRYRKSVCNGYIAAAGRIGNGTQITDEEYREIVSAFEKMPTAPIGYAYKLKDENLEWELVELPPMPEPELTDEEALAILLGGDGT